MGEVVECEDCMGMGGWWDSWVVGDDEYEDFYEECSTCAGTGELDADEEV